MAQWGGCSGACCSLPVGWHLHPLPSCLRLLHISVSTLEKKKEKAIWRKVTRDLNHFNYTHAKKKMMEYYLSRLDITICMFLPGFCSLIAYVFIQKILLSNVVSSLLSPCILLPKLTPYSYLHWNILCGKWDRNVDLSPDNCVFISETLIYLLFLSHSSRSTLPTYCTSLHVHIVKPSVGCTIWRLFLRGWQSDKMCLCGLEVCKSAALNLTCLAGFKCYIGNILQACFAVLLQPI